MYQTGYAIIILAVLFCFIGIAQYNSNAGTDWRNQRGQMRSSEVSLGQVRSIDEKLKGEYRLKSRCCKKSERILIHMKKDYQGLNIWENKNQKTSQKDPFSLGKFSNYCYQYVLWLATIETAHSIDLIGW